MKANCWEFKKCGRESQGPNAEELGVCQAYLENKLDGVHGGMNAGRACWVVAGTMCGGNLQGTYAQKEKNCLRCDFYNLVYEEEADKFMFMTKLYDKLKSARH
jgi:hypothetical protein